MRRPKKPRRPKIDLLSMRMGVAIAVSLVALAVSGIAASASSSPQQGRSETASGMAAFEAAVVERINQVRRGRGLPGLRTNRRLAAAADFHSRDMGRRGYFEHESADGTAFWRRIQRFYPSRGFRSWTVGENLLWGSDNYSAAFAVRGWMRSPPHRKNILSRAWREIGLGAAFFARAPGEYEGRAVTILTADFGSRS
jgi:uncharacterized protein YkwD